MRELRITNHKSRITSSKHPAARIANMTKSALPILTTMAPRRRDATPEGSVGLRFPTAQPQYTPVPIEQRPHAAEIRDWMGVLHDTSFLQLAARADALRREKHPDNVVSYIVDRNINYTNL